MTPTHAATQGPRCPRPTTSLGGDWTFPTPRVEKLDNGLEVWLFHLPGQHVVALDLVQPIALDAEDPRVEGVGMLALRASDEGTINHPHGRVSQLLENVGAVYSGRTTHTVTASSLDVPATRFSDALPLFADIILRPDYAEDDIERHRALRMAEIEQTLASGSGSASMALRKVRWQEGSRNARPAGGTPATVAAITRADVLDFHERQWGPQGSVLVLGGDFAQDPMPLVASEFGGWLPAADAHAASSEAAFAGPGDASTVHLVHRPDAVQIDLRLGGIGIDRRDPEWASLQAASVAIGGSFLSRLNRVIREERGYTYGIHLASVPQREAGTWTVNANIRTEVAAEALTATLALLDVTTKPLTEEEITDATNQLVGLSPLRNDTAEAIVGQASSLAAAGMDAEQVNRHRDALRQVTAESASAAAGRILAGGRGHLVVVGNADQLNGPLEAAGFEVSAMEL